MKKAINLLLLVQLVFVTSCTGAKKLAQELPAVPAVQEQALEEVVITAEEEEIYRASEKRVNDLIHTKLEVNFDWDKQYLNGVATLDFKPHFYPTKVLTLDAKGFEINSVSLVSNGSKVGLKHGYDGAQLVIELDRVYTLDQTYQVVIDYIAKPNELNVQGSSAITSAKGLYFINPDGSDPNKPQQIWTQGETEASSCWFPTIDAPNEKTTQEIYITVQDRFKTLSNGKKMSSNNNGDGTRTDYWKQDVPHTPYLFMMTVGEFDVYEDTWNGKVVDYYMEAGHSKTAKQIFGNTPEMIEFYSNKLKYPYPWDKYSQVVVREFVSGAMENTSAVVFFDAMHLDERALLDETHEDIVAHELFHHWFGDIVTCESWSNLPLNESFANYGEYLWIEHKYGVEEADYHRYNELGAYLNEAAQGKKVSLIRYDYEDKEDMFDSHSYAKGGTVLHMLRNYVGDDAFWASLNRYLVDNEFQAVEIHHLRLAFEEVTGEDLNWFFNQWFLGPGGHPILEMKYEYEPIDDKTYVFIDQIQEEAPFKLPIFIDVYNDGKKSREKVFIDSRTTKWSTNGRPDWINVDGDKMLNCEKIDNKPAEQFVRQFNEGELFWDRLEAVQFLAAETDNPDAQAVVMKALDDPFWAIREEAVASIDLASVKEPGDWIDKLKQIATGDEKAPVRSMAMQKLAELGDPAMTDFFIKGIGDQSYAVLSSSLNGLLSSNKDVALSEAKKLASMDQAAVVSSVSTVYGILGSDPEVAYFEKGFSKQGVSTLIDMYLGYAELLPRVASSEKLKTGVQTLGTAAVDQDVKWLRFFAMRSLNNVRDGLGAKQAGLTDQAEKDQIGSVIDTIGNLMNNAKEKESDKQVIGLYQRFGY